MADTYAPAYEVTGPITRVTAAYVISGTLDRWFRQTHLPVAVTKMGDWLMGEVGYIPPGRSGQGWPR